MCSPYDVPDAPIIGPYSEEMYRMERNLVWSRLDEPGTEHLRLTEEQHSITANGLIIAVTDNVPYRISYTIHCDAFWRVHEVRVELLDSHTPKLHLRANGKGNWTTDANEHVASLIGCIDVDISATPFTNTLAIQRLNLAVDEIAEITVAYIKVPEMRVTSVKQRYTCLDSSGERYQYAGYPSGYQAEITVDRDKLVIEYPELFTRVWASEEIAVQKRG